MKAYAARPNSGRARHHGRLSAVSNAPRSPSLVPSGKTRGRTRIWSPLALTAPVRGQMASSLGLQRTLSAKAGPSTFSRILPLAAPIGTPPHRRQAHVFGPGCVDPSVAALGFVSGCRRDQVLDLGVYDHALPTRSGSSSGPYKTGLAQRSQQRRTGDTPRRCTSSKLKPFSVAASKSRTYDTALMALCPPFQFDTLGHRCPPSPPPEHPELPWQL